MRARIIIARVPRGQREEVPVHEIILRHTFGAKKKPFGKRIIIHFDAAVLHAITLSGHRGRSVGYGAEPTLKRPSATAMGVGVWGAPPPPPIDGIQITLLKHKW